MRKNVFLLFAFVNIALAFSQSIKTEDLIKELTTEEKINLLCSDAEGILRLGIPKYQWWSECLNGVARNGKATVFPKPIAMGCTWDTDLIRKVAEAISDEARAKYNIAIRENGYSKIYQGLTFFSPTLNLARDPRWGRTSECFSEDPLLTGKIGESFIKGLQGDDPFYLKVAATAKHFVANNEENRRWNGSAQVDETSLREYYFPAFEMSVRNAKVASVMSAYNALNGVPCSTNSFLLTDVLRNEWQFDGVVISDGSAMEKIFTHHKYVSSLAKASALALKSGCDMTLRNEYKKGLKEALRLGYITDKDLEKSLFRVLELRKRLGIYGNVKSPYTNIPDSVVECTKHRNLALEVARNSIVLLKNMDEILPINVSSIKKMALIGDAFCKNYLGDYSGKPEYQTLLCDEMKKRMKGIDIRLISDELRFLETTEKLNVDKYIEESDIVVLYIRDDRCAEGKDRENLELSDNYLNLISNVSKLNKNLILVLGGTSPLVLTQVSSQVKAIVNSWIAGQMESVALAEILCGEVNPSAKTSVTFISDESQLPPFDDYDVKHGRSYQYFKGNVLYPFGYGLSYTKYLYDLPKIKGKYDDGLMLSVKVTNIGKMDGYEIVQCYASNASWRADGLMNKLVDFKKVYIPKGDTVEVVFRIPFSRIARWDSNVKSWNIQKGRYSFSLTGVSTDNNYVDYLVD